MSQVTITIDIDKPTFTEAADPERVLSNILIDLAINIRNGRIDEDGAAISDDDGNPVGRIEMDGEE